METLVNVAVKYFAQSALDLHSTDSVSGSVAAQFLLHCTSD